MGKAKWFGIETLAERVKVKLTDGEETFFKRYQAEDVKIIKDVQKEEDAVDGVDSAELKELEQLEKLGQSDIKNEEDI